MRYLVFILFICLRTAVHSQHFEDGIYPVLAEADKSRGVLKQAGDRTIAIEHTVLIKATDFMQATAAFDNKHQPVLAIKISEIKRPKWATTMKSYRDAGISSPGIALVMNNEVITTGTPGSDLFDSRVLFTGSYTFEETKRLAEKVNLVIGRKAIPDKRQAAEEQKLSALLDTLFTTGLKAAPGNADLEHLVYHDFIYRAGSGKLTDRAGLLQFLKRSGQQRGSQVLKYHSTPLYFYWNRDYTACEVVGLLRQETAATDPEKGNDIIYVSTWRKDKDWKLWRLSTN